MSTSQSLGKSAVAIANAALNSVVNVEDQITNGVFNCVSVPTPSPNIDANITLTMANSGQAFLVNCGGTGEYSINIPLVSGFTAKFMVFTAGEKNVYITTLGNTSCFYGSISENNFTYSISATPYFYFVDGETTVGDYITVTVISPECVMVTANAQIDGISWA